ncbi:MAG: HAD-IIB family hydrolase [Candidatus Paceibacterota bacterium]|jgi:hypothetical protein
MNIPKLVAFDLDGTIAPSKHQTEADMGLLLASLLAKLPVAIMSGASFHQFERQFLPALPVDANFSNLYLFPTNAAACYVYKDGKWQEQYNEKFTDIEREKIMNALNEAMTETNFQSFVPQTWGEQIEDRGAQITLSALGQQAPLEEKQKWDPTREKRQPLYDLLCEKLPDFSIGLNATTSIDITKKGVNKGYGVLKLAELTKIPVGEMLYVGDALGPGGNDAIVIPTCIQTYAVADPEDTKKFIKSII